LNANTFHCLWWAPKKLMQVYFTAYGEHQKNGLDASTYHHLWWNKIFLDSSKFHFSWWAWKFFWMQVNLGWK
jgi:hypothetical protein